MTMNDETPAYVYVTENPYGVHTLNTDGNRANQLHRFTDHKDAYAFRDADPGHREMTNQREATRITNAQVKAGGGAEDFPIAYMDRPFRVGR